MSEGPEAEPPRPLLGPVFWLTLVIGFGLVVAGLVLALVVGHPRAAPSQAAPSPLGERHASR